MIRLSSCAEQEGSEVLKKLSRRERQVFWMLAEAPPKQVAQTLEISYKTVQAHVYSIYCKLGLHSHSGLTRLAEQIRESPQS